jgi:deazaflavin-dependent oxidoreductase (nitroreductase family)
MDIRYAEPFPLYERLRRLPLPIWFYRLLPGWALGERGLLLTHIGRRGLQLRQTLLEIVAHDEAADIYIAAAGWGKRADWFRTIQKQPHVLVEVGHRRFEAIAARLSESEAKRVLRDYACRCPSAFHYLAGTMALQQLPGLYDDYQTLAHAIRLIALRPLHRQDEQANVVPLTTTAPVASFERHFTSMHDPREYRNWKVAAYGSQRQSWRAITPADR